MRGAISRWLPRDISSSTAIGIATIGILLPLILVIGYGLHSLVERDRVETLARVSVQSDGLARALDRELKGYINTAEVLAGSRHIQADDLRIMGELARDAAAKTGGNFVLFDKSFKQLINTRVPPDAPLPQTRNPEALVAAFNSTQAIVANIGIGTVSNRPQFVVHVPIFVEGEVRYVLAYVPDQGGMRRILGETFMPAGWLAAIIDGNGILVARSVRHDEFFGTSASDRFVSRAAESKGVIESSDLEGRPSITSYQKSAVSSWRTVVWVPKSVLEAPQRQAFRLMLGLVVIALALSLASALLFERLIRAPARALVNASHAIGSGRSVPIHPTIIREANIVGKAMQNAAELIRRREAELRDSEFRLRMALSSANAGAWEWDLATGQLRCTPEFLSLCGNGMPATSAPFQVWLEFAVAPEDREQVEASLRAAVASDADHVQIEFRAVRPGADPGWVMAIGQIERIGDEPVRIRGIAIDTNERRQSEEHLRFLMNELNHRSKNLIALVQALAKQTARGSTALPDFLEKFQPRVAALASAQDMIISQDWIGVGLTDLARGQISTFLDTDNGQVTFTGPDVVLTADAAQAIGMALHELATNSVKYGALSVHAGRVAIDWSLTRAEAEKELHISWIESGGPTVQPPSRKGFGSTVIEKMVAQKLEGRVAIDFKPEGLNYSLAIPATHVMT